MKIPRKRLHSYKDDCFEELVLNHKRKCTIDVSANERADDWLIEKDEVSQKLLEKLTTPKKMTKIMSFSYSNLDHFGLRLDFNSDIESMDNDELDKRSACEFPPVTSYAADIIEDAYL